MNAYTIKESEYTTFDTDAWATQTYKIGTDNAYEGINHDVILN